MNFGNAGHIGGFAATDAIDLVGSWSLLHFSENTGGTLATLALTNGTHTLDLNFVGNFTQNSFTIATGTTTIIGHA